MFAIVSTPAAAGLDPDEAPLVEAFRAELGGGAARVVHWGDPGVDWARFELALIRSTWDYIDDLDRFLGWVDATARVTPLWNAPRVVHWNVDKRYLAELAADGIPIVPTTFVAPGDAAPAMADTCVVKPTVGAGANRARRSTADEVAGHVAELHALGMTAMVQPYLALLDDVGETGLCFLPDGAGRLRYSHAFRKAAILDVDEPPLDGDLVACESITPRTPSVDELTLGHRVLRSASVAALGPLAYARVDLAPTGAGPVVMELELVEPSFHFRAASGSAARAAAGFVALARRRA